MRSPSPAERGSVTAEFAIAIPAVVLLLALCLSAVQVATLQLRLQDAAALAAQTAARGGGSTAGALELVRGASVEVQRRDDFVCARLVLEAKVFGGLLAGIPLAARSCSPSIAEGSPS